MVDARRAVEVTAPTGRRHFGMARWSPRDSRQQRLSKNTAVTLTARHYT